MFCCYMMQGSPVCPAQMSQKGGDYQSANMILVRVMLLWEVQRGHSNFGSVWNVIHARGAGIPAWLVQ